MKADSDETTAPIKGLNADTMSELISRLAGVHSVEIDLRSDGSPRLRIRLDGSVPTDEVNRQIRQVLGMPDPVGAPGAHANRKTAGLGRGLSDILAADLSTTPPNLFESTENDGILTAGLALVAVEETAGGISVRAADSSGGIAFAPVEDTRSLNQAVVSAVGRLCNEQPLPRLTGVEVRDVEGAAVLTVVLALGDGRKAAGAALVQGGMPFTLARAVWEALASVN